jgi:hypothetical protein
MEARATRRRAAWTIRRYSDLGEMKRDEYVYWQGRPGHERIAAISELTTEQYAMKGRHVSRLQRTLVRLEQT